VPDRYPRGSLETAKHLLRQHAIGWLHGLYRRSNLTGVAPSLFSADPWGADIVFLLDVCLSWEVVGSNDAIIYKRVGNQNGPKTPRAKVNWQCWFAWALMQVILKSSLSSKEKMELLGTYSIYLKWFYLKKGIKPWAKLWTRAGYQWLKGVDQP